MHTMDAETALRRAEQGMQYIAIGSELKFMTTKAQEIVADLTGAGVKDLARY